MSNGNSYQSGAIGAEPYQIGSAVRWPELADKGCIILYSSSTSLTDTWIVLSRNDGSPAPTSIANCSFTSLASAKTAVFNATPGLSPPGSYPGNT